MSAQSPRRAHPLGSEAARRFEELLAVVTPDEAVWLSGFFAGFAAQRPTAAAPLPAPAEASPLVILYGSQTGHSAALARRIEGLARERGIAARLADMAAFSLADLKAVRQILVVVSTYGEGAPPDSARPFHEALLGRRAPRLDGVGFAVLGLGDSSYQKFCQTAREIDARLEELGATRLAARQDCDVDYQEEAEGWSRSVLDAFAARTAPASVAAAPAAPAVTAAPAASAVTAAHDEAHPFPAAILDSIRITGRGSDKLVRHVELSLAGSGLSYQPGDALGVQPRNDPALVAELVRLLRFDGDAGVAGLLEREREITVATPRFVERYAPLAKSRALTRLARPEQRAALESYLKDRQIIDIVREHPAKGLAPDAFVATLRRLRPRLYSLASSPAAFPDEAHLTIGLVEFGAPDHRRHGVASGLLAVRLAVDDTVPVHVVANPHFHLPADPMAPIIMIGAGTGVAPFRAFLQHREAAGAAGRSWLVFGERRMRTDFLYQTELLAWIKSGVLSRMDVAFSRDQAHKVYVQHRLRERGRDLFAWLEEGASVYVCGDAAGMAPAVESALVDLIAAHGGRSPEQAAAYLAALAQSGRYRRDVY